MSRRVRTLVVGGVLFLVMAVLAISLPVPYVILSPGPTINTLGSYGGQKIIVLNGRTENGTHGNLNLTTVSISTGRVSVLQAISGWLAGDQVVVPRETIYPPGRSEKQVAQQDATDFTDSQTSAEGAAFCELRYPRYFGVIGTSPDMSPAGALKYGDKLLSLNGAPITDQKSLLATLAGQKPGSSGAVVVQRKGTPTTVNLTLLAPASGRTGARIGVAVADTCFAGFGVSLGLNDAIGGPSAGMMFALGIIDKVGADDLTGGRFVAGTGTIDLDGKVGPIGGIQLKMIAARRAGATVFLAPEGNCSDVRGNVPKGLTVAKVSTLHQAVQALDAVKAGTALTGC
ncbi:MAG: PDZ domain-containing protein [Actinomycetota bacterium]|nr:PDZ domain-containing protein [Actinomycetota bacterium]